MAEVKLFEVNLGETINNIKRLENELKEVKKQYKEAQIGSEAYYKAQAAGKELTAEIKKQNDALKANTNALGGVNSAAKFAEGSYGKLKQQIKENKAALDAAVEGSKEFDEALKERIRLENQRIAIEEKIPSLLQKRIQGGIEEAKTIQELRQQIKEYTAAVIRGEEGAAQKLAELKDKLEDVKDATNSFKGSGVERLTASMNLLRESLVNVDFDKFKVGLEGLSASMKAIPLFLLVDLLGRLIEKFGIIDGIVTALTDIFYAFTDALGFTNKEAEKLTKSMVEGLEKQKEVVEARYDAEIKLAKAAGKNTEQLELQKLSLVEQNINFQVQKYKDLAKKKGELNEDEKKEYEKLQLDLIAASAERAAKEAEISKRISDSRKDYATTVKNSEDALRKARQSDSQNAIDEAKKSRDEQLKILDQQFQDGKLYNGNTKQNIAEFEKAKQNIIQASNIEIAKINAEAAKEAKEKRNKANEEELKRQKELLDGVKRNQQEEISFLNSAIQERKNLNQQSFDEERKLAEYQLQIVLTDRDATYEQIYAAQVEFDAKMIELQKNQLAYEKQLQDEAFQKDIEARQTQQNIIIEQEQAWNEVNFSDAMTTLETQFEAKQELLNLQREQELYGLEENSLKYQEIVAKYANQEVELLRQKEAEKAAIRASEIKSVTDTAQVILNLGALLTKEQEQQAAFAKMAALINIGANTATAISNLTATSFSVSSPDNILTGGLAAYAKLATGLVTITSNMVQAKQLLNSFEEGGYTGEGNPHEQSTNLGTKSYTYHKDEYVIPSRVLNTQKGSILASQLEGMRLGMSNPMPHISGMFDGGFTGRSASSSANMQLSNQAMMERMMLSMPQPVVRVTDINKTQTSVERAVQVSSL
jgi:hypothetical protein